MAIKIISLLFCIIGILFTHVAFANDPVVDYAKQINNGSDPQKKNCNLVKIEKDLDGNGKTDYILSSSNNCDLGASWGNAGGSWRLFMHINQNYKEYDLIFFHPLAVKFMPSGKEGEFYMESYHRMSCCEGSIATILITEEGSKLIEKQEYKDTNIEGAQGHNKIKETFYQRPIKTYHCLVQDIVEDRCTWKEGYY